MLAPLEYYRMLIADEARTNAYRDALRALIKPDDVVLDLGSGTGILALLAHRAGARRVFAIDNTHAADAAAFLAQGRIEVLHGLSRELDLLERANVLVTETLGMLGFDESIAGSVADARKRLLRDGARVIPARVAVHLAPVSMPDAYATHVDWYREPRYDLDLSSLRQFAANAIYPLPIARDAFVAEPREVLAADLTTIESPHVGGRATFTIARDATVHGFAGWFAATLADGITIDNAPGSGTHWRQAFLPLPQPRAMRAGDALEVALDSYDGGRWRWRGDGFDQTTAFAMPACIAARKPRG